MADEVSVVVPKREDGMMHDTVGITPSTMPNVAINAMAWWKIVLIRAAKTYVTTMLSLIPALGAGAAEHVGLGAAHGILLTAAELSVYPTILVLLGSAAMILGRLDESVPSSWHA